MSETPRRSVSPRWWGPPIGGLALALAFPPLDLLPLALVASWPLLRFLESDDGLHLRRAFTAGYLFGLAFFGAVLYWIAGLTGFSHMAVPAYLASVLVMGLNGGLAAVAAALLRRQGIRPVVSLPLAWVAVEWLRSFGDLGFTWAVVGDAAAGYPLLIQTAELGGAYLVSLWVMGLSSALYGAIVPGALARRWRSALVAIALAVSVPVYGAIRIQQLDAESSAWPVLRAAAVQPNVPQDRKWDESFIGETLDRLVRLTRQADREDPDLVVWPESAVPVYLRYDPRARDLVPSLAGEIGAPIFTGTNDADTLSGRAGNSAADYRVFNAAYLVRPEGIAEGRYAKRRLVPVAERVPFVPGVATGFFERLSSWTGQFEPGRTWPTWEVDDQRFGAMICYESVFPNVSRKLVRNGAGFLVNITNDAWFGPTAAPYQHASHIALRAVESRVSVLRSANTGISGWVDPIGRWREETPLYTEGVVVADLPVPGRSTPYVRWGNWAPAIALLALVGIGIEGRRRRGGLVDVAHKP